MKFRWESFSIVQRNSKFGETILCVGSSRVEEAWCKDWWSGPSLGSFAWPKRRLYSPKRAEHHHLISVFALEEMMICYQARLRSFEAFFKNQNQIWCPTRIVNPTGTDWFSSFRLFAESVKYWSFVTCILHYVVVIVQFWIFSSIRWQENI